MIKLDLAFETLPLGTKWMITTNEIRYGSDAFNK